MKKLDITMFVLLVIGGLNWGLVGLFDFNLVEYIVRETWLDRVIYVLVGISAIYLAVGIKSIQRRCSGGK